MLFRRLLACTACAVLLAGCAAPTLAPDERAALERPARSLETRGQWREAALAWEQAAQAAPGDAGAAFRLNAADALLEAGDGAGAAAVVATLPESLAQDLALRRVLVLAEASLLAGDATGALSRVGPAIQSVDPSLVARYRRIRADALELTGDVLGAARERALRDPLIASPQESYRNRQQLWELLASVPEDRLAQVPLAPPATDSGWFELARIVRRHRLDVPALESEVARWTARYPGHPAGEQIVPELLETARTDAQPPAKVALLLPRSGPFADAAAAVRDGFVAAWFADAPNPDRPELVVRDASEGDLGLTYAQVVAEGAQFVVGPLSKEEVNELLAGADLSVTTLTLNYPSADPAVADAPRTAAGAPPPDGASPAPRDLQRVFHFALAPEDEARRAAELAFERGARQAGVLAPEGEWGERISAAFAERWRTLGGVVAAERRFPEEATGLSAAVEQLLNIDQSEARGRALRATLVRDVKHEPLPRSDLDVIFMAAFPQAARQLKPLLLFHRAGDVPVVATSHVYAGQPDPESDVDLEGIVFGDMPWLLDPGSYTLPAQVGRIWPASRGALGRLYAFGADAYTLALRLRELRAGASTAAVPGLTGTLSLDDRRRVHREFEWAQIREGVPVRIRVGPSSAAPAPARVARG